MDIMHRQQPATNLTAMAAVVKPVIAAGTEVVIDHRPRRHVALESLVECNLRRLRRKLGPAGEQIETVVGVGYRLRA